MLFMDEQKLLDTCVKCMKNPEDVQAYDELLMGCRSMGRYFLRLYNIIPTTTERMVYSGYNGTGTISMYRTISEFCRNGKTLDGVISRNRVRDVKDVSLAILYDDSNSMTAWWRNKTMAVKVEESHAPQTYSKVACLSLMEGLSRKIKIDLWTFGNFAHGPYNVNSNMYRELISRNGSGGTRLDLALQSLIDHGWEKGRGIRIVVILTDGIPEMGRSIYDEDVLVNMSALSHLKYLISRKVRVLYIQLLTDESRRFRKSGGYNMAEFGSELGKMGCTLYNVDTESKIKDTLFDGLSKAIQKY